MAKATTPMAAGAVAGTVARVAIVERGVALIALIAAAGGAMALTQDEGSELVANAFATVDPATVDENGASMVTLTDLGRAALAPAPAPAATSAVFAIDDGVAIPTDKTRRGRTGGYPFDLLAVGQSFHVPVTADNDKPVDRLASSVSGARAKYAVETAETETVKVKVYKRGEDGKSYVKDAEGKRVIESETEETRPVMQITRDFMVKAVDASDPKGPGARVWRTA